MTDVVLRRIVAQLEGYEGHLCSVCANRTFEMLPQALVCRECGTSVRIYSLNIRLAHDGTLTMA